VVVGRPNNGVMDCVHGLQDCGKDAEDSTTVELFYGQPDNGPILKDGGVNTGLILSGE